MRRHTHPSLHLFTVSLILAACSGAPDPSEAPDMDGTGTVSDAIVGGRRDHGHPAVVAIDIGGEALCTGTLIAPSVVLTARHCVSRTTEAVSCPSRTAQIQGERDPSSLTILVGDDIDTATPVAAGEAIDVPMSSVLCGQDIALVRLDRPVSSVKPLPVDLDAQLVVGEKLTMVGFGKRGSHLGAGKKYSRKHVPVLGVGRSELVVGEVSCNGDSGGPALDEATGRVVGVVSRGGPGCQGALSRNIYTRADAFATLVRGSLAAASR